MKIHIINFNLIKNMKSKNNMSFKKDNKIFMR